MAPTSVDSQSTLLTLPGLDGLAESVFHHLPLGLVVMDRGYNILFRNSAAATLFPEGTDIAELLARGTAKGQYQDWPSEFRQALDAGAPRRFDSVIFHAGPKDERLLDLACIPLRDEKAGLAVGAMLVCEDVTHRAGLEQRLAVSERMAAVGRLAARVAHELNNPLDGVLRYVNLALRMLQGKGQDKVTDFLNESRTGLLRMTQIVSELLEFSRSLDTHYEEANINAAVEEAIRTLQDQAAASGVVLAASFRDEHVPSLRGAKLFQVCCNLIKNAIDAMPQGGTLTVTTGIVGREVVLKFEDTGVGLPENHAAIFEPFFTTKAPGKGTGLGLAICKDYIARLNGSITAANRPEGGAAFTIRIPLESCSRGASQSHA